MGNRIGCHISPEKLVGATQEVDFRNLLCTEVRKSTWLSEVKNEGNLKLKKKTIEFEQNDG